jgi:hypothetical protein
MINIRQNQAATPFAPLARANPRQEAAEYLPIPKLSHGLLAWSRITNHPSSVTALRRVDESRLALGSHWGGFRVALGWLWGAYRLPTNTLCGGFDVALGGFAGTFLPAAPEARCALKSAVCSKPLVAVA